MAMLRVRVGGLYTTKQEDRVKIVRRSRSPRDKSFPFIGDNGERYNEAGTAMAAAKHPRSPLHLRKAVTEGIVQAMSLMPPIITTPPEALKAPVAPAKKAAPKRATKLDVAPAIGNILADPSQYKVKIPDKSVEKIIITLPAGHPGISIVVENASGKKAR